MSDKQSLRKLMLEKLNNQKEERRGEKSIKIKERLFRLGVFKKAKTVMMYLALSSEVQTYQMIEGALRLGKRVALPVCGPKAKKITPCLIKGLEAKYLKEGPYGIKEPVSKKAVNSREIDLCVVPGLAFDLSGNRLGRGMGYYDRFLGTLAAGTPKIGLAFKFQVLKSLSSYCLPHDLRVDKLIFA